MAVARVVVAEGMYAEQIQLEPGMARYLDRFSDALRKQVSGEAGHSGHPSLRELAQQTRRW